MKRASLLLLLALSALVLSAAGCKRETTAEAPPPRPVRTVIAEKRDLGQSVVLTGQILAEKESSLAFRIGGRIDTGEFCILYNFCIGRFHDRAIEFIQ